MNHVDALYEWILASAMSPGALALLFAFCTLDGFFPPVPSESVVTALSAVYVHRDAPRLLPLILLAGVGAFLGDNIAYLIGRRLHPLLQRRPALAAKVQEAAARIEDRGAELIIPARFVPVGRVVINMGAGLAGFPHRRFMAITAVSASAWALYATVIGVVAGRWFHQNPLLGAALGVALGVGLGVLADRVGHRWRARRAAA